MKLKIYISVLMVIVFSVCRSQHELSTPMEFPSKMPEKYIFNTKSDYQKIVSRSERGVKKRDLKRFAETVTYGKQELFSSGNVYLNWMEMEDYLNRILQQILPDSLKKKSNIHAYLSRDADQNAYAIHDGSLFFNVGMFADVQNEAAIAIILGHELSHYLNDDARQSFLKGLTLYTKKNSNKKLALALDKAHEDREQEKTADLTGFKFAENAGYDLYYGICNFNTFKESMDIENLKHSKDSKLMSSAVSSEKDKFNSLDVLLATHPELSDRVAYLKSYMESTKRSTDKKDFIVLNKTNFNALQARARHENLNILLTHNQFRECVQKAFTYYLIEPDDHNFIYYLLESIRRLMYFNYNYKTQGFLTEDNESKKFKPGEGILHDIRYLMPDDLKRSSIKASTLTDSTAIEFETYEQAFQYFSKLALSKDITESILTVALNENDKKKSDSLLNEYLNHKNSRFKEYANAVRNDRLYKELEQNNKSIVLFNNVDFSEEHNYGQVDRLILSEQRSAHYFNKLRSLLSNKYPEKELINVNQLAYENLATKINLKNAIRTTQLIRPKDKFASTSYYREVEDEKRKRQIDVFILNPDYWNLFKQNGLNAIEYIQLSSFEDKTAVMQAQFRLLVTVISSIAFPPYLIYYLFTDSDIYNHSVSYYSFDVKTKAPYYYTHEVNHKLNAERAKRRVDHAFRSKSEIR
jgi:hypothetical protein